MDKDIGRIVEVRGINVKAKLFKLLPPYLVNEGQVVSAPKINSFVKAKVGLDTVICQINGEYNLEKDSNISDYYIDLTVKGYIENNKFIQGLRMLPIVSSNISLLSNEEYSIIYNYNKSISFKIGIDLFEINKDIYLNFILEYLATQEAEKVILYQIFIQIISKKLIVIIVVMQKFYCSI